jgi:broad specificity phosphatase PhoE
MNVKIKPSLLLMRHGQTSWNRTGQLTSRSDIELSDFGIAQCINSAKINHKYPISKIICSPKQRAMTAASIFSEHLDTRPEIIIDNNLIEIDFGIFEGQSGSDILKSKSAKPYKKWLLGHIKNRRLWFTRLEERLLSQ